jgi:hypothetical protein
MLVKGFCPDFVTKNVGNRLDFITKFSRRLIFSLAIRGNPGRIAIGTAGESHYEFWANCREIQVKTLLELQERVGNCTHIFVNLQKVGIFSKNV